eukprot:jgi/Chlat1/7027/Chrsp56S00527
MSAAIVPLSAANGWGETTAGIVQGSFLWGYALTGIPGGAAADALGSKPVLALGVCVWSLCTLLTPWAASTRSITTLIAVRALLGAGQGVALPCMNLTLSRWVGKGERARAVATAMAGFHLGSMSGLLLAPPLMSRFGLQGPFIMLGALGAMWLCAWLTIMPSHHTPTVPTPQPVESRAHSDIAKTSSNVGYGALVRSPACWAIVIANGVNNFGYFVLLSWMPLFFHRAVGLDIRRSSWLSALPWAVMAACGSVAGFASDTLVARRVSITTVRKLMQSIGFLGPAAALTALSFTTQPGPVLACFSVALGLSSFSQAGFLVNHAEVAPRFAGILHGTSNAFGTLTGIAGIAMTGFILERTGGKWQAVLAATAAAYVIGTAVWLAFATGEKRVD